MKTDSTATDPAIGSSPGSRPGAARLVSRALLLLLLGLPLAGCNLLIDEFTWLDRVPPAADDAPMAASEQ